MVPEVAIYQCPKTQKFFLEDEYEFSKVENPDFPYGKVPDPRKA